MTKEIRLVFDIKDVIGVRYQCLKPTCQGEILYKLNGNWGVNSRCPTCRTEWFATPTIPPSGPVEPRAYLLQVLRDIVRQDQDGAPPLFRARSEMECEETD